MTSYWETQYSVYVTTREYLREAPTTVEGHREQAINLLRHAHQYNANTEASIAAAEVHVRLAELLVAERAATAAEQTAEALTRLAGQPTAHRWFQRGPKSGDAS